jgi:hypothetical protein
MNWFSKKKPKKLTGQPTSKHQKTDDSNVLQFKKKTDVTKQDSVRDKQEIAMYVQNINNKLKDPVMARKAADIVTELLKKNA